MFRDVKKRSQSKRNKVSKHRRSDGHKIARVKIVAELKTVFVQFWRRQRVPVRMLVRFPVRLRSVSFIAGQQGEGRAEFWSGQNKIILRCCIMYYYNAVDKRRYCSSEGHRKRTERVMMRQNGPVAIGRSPINALVHPPVGYRADKITLVHPPASQPPRR